MLAQQRNEVWQRVVILVDLFGEGELFVACPSRPWLSFFAHFAGLP